MVLGLPQRSCTNSICCCADHGGVPLGGKSWLGSLGRDIAILGQHPVFVLNLIAYCPIQGAFGAYTFWGPKASTAPLSLTVASWIMSDAVGKC